LRGCKKYYGLGKLGVCKRGGEKTAEIIGPASMEILQGNSKWVKRVNVHRKKGAPGGCVGALGG